MPYGRTSAQVKIDVLRAIQGNPMTLTHIMYATRSNCVVLKRVLNKLIDLDVVQKIPPETSIERRNRHGAGKSHIRSIYKLTEKGRQVLQSWTELETKVLPLIDESPIPLYRLGA